MLQAPKRRILRTFTIGQKLKIIEFAKNSNNRKAEDAFGVDESVIRRWRRREGELRELDWDTRNISFKGKTITKQRFRLSGGGSKIKYPELEKDLVKWFKERRAKFIPVTQKAIRNKALGLAAEKNIKNFKCSQGWINGWRNRNGISRRRRTNLAQKMPEDLYPKVLKLN